MNWGMYGILIILALFILLLVFSPNLSCFGKRLKSPLYPLFRSKKTKKKAEDYGFRLVEGELKKATQEKESQAKKTEDYGFRLD